LVVTDKGKLYLQQGNPLKIQSEYSKANTLNPYKDGTSKQISTLLKKNRKEDMSTATHSFLYLHMQ